MVVLVKMVLLVMVPKSMMMVVEVLPAGKNGGVDLVVLRRSGAVSVSKGGVVRL